jgi:hypothetical protein
MQRQQEHSGQCHHGKVAQSLMDPHPGQFHLQFKATPDHSSWINTSSPKLKNIFHQSVVLGELSSELSSKSNSPVLIKYNHPNMWIKLNFSDFVTVQCLMTVSVNTAVFWDVMPCNLIYMCQCSGRNYCLHLQDSRESYPRRPYIIFIVTTKSASNFMQTFYIPHKLHSEDNRGVRISDLCVPGVCVSFFRFN